MKTVALNQAARRGARQVLSQCLGMIEGDSLVLIYDESTVEVADILSLEADILAVDVSRQFVGLDLQRRYSAAPNGTPPLPDWGAITNARGVLSALTDSSDTTVFRRDLIKRGTDRSRRWAHVPGFSVELLATALNADYEEIDSRNELLALALCLSSSAELVTSDGYTESLLRMQLGGLDRPPITSTGIIALDTWGNLPGGETFIAPIEGSAEGEFCLNGAMRGYVLSDEQNINMRFSDGLLVHYEGPREAKDHFSSLIAPQAGGSLGLAELGIGTNASITELNGASIHDEKCAGTAHIAIGDNSRYGGSIAAAIHEDLVVTSPTLHLDGREVLREGALTLRAEDWRDNINFDQAQLPAAGEVFDGRKLYSKTSILTEVDPRGRLRVRREVAAGRRCVYVLGDSRSTTILASLLSFFPPFPQKVRLSDLQSRAKQELFMAEPVCQQALAILVKHRLVEQRNSPE